MRSRRQVSATALPATYKALDGWKVATPGDLIDRGDWWTLLGDPQLDALVAQGQRLQPDHRRRRGQLPPGPRHRPRTARQPVPDHRPVGFGDPGRRLGFGE
jgi:hypothetical protein